MVGTRAGGFAGHALACAVLALAAACTTGSATGGPSDVGASFTQLPIQVGTDEGLVRLTNHGPAGLPVEGVGLDWAGYGGEFMRDKDSVVPPGRTIDFPVVLPSPDCDTDPDEIAAVVDTGGGTVRLRMSVSGDHLLRRIRRLACQREYVLDRVDVGYAGSWRFVGDGRDTFLLGALRVTRGEGNEPVRLLEVSGSPLYELGLPGDARLAPGEAAGRIPLRLTTGDRCDEHSRSDVTAPFNFRLTLRVGTQEAQLGVTPPREVRRLAAELVDRVCP